MKCFVCPYGETQSGYKTLTVERGQCTIIVKRIPAQVCDTCGESYLSAEMTQQVMQWVEASVNPHAEVEILHFAA